MRLLLTLGLLAGSGAIARADAGPDFGHSHHLEYSARLDVPIPGYSFFLYTQRSKPTRLFFTLGEPFPLDVTHYRRRRSTTVLYAIPDNLLPPNGDPLPLIESWREPPPGVRVLGLPGIEEVGLFDPRRRSAVEVVIRPGPDGPEFETVTRSIEGQWAMPIFGGLFSLLAIYLGIQWVRKRRAPENSA